MTKAKKILSFWNKRSTKKKLKCTNDHLLEKLETKLITPLIKKNAKVLDLGCGDGSLLKHLKIYKNIKGVGVDFSEQLIKISKKNRKGIEFFCHDMSKINKLKQINGKYDYIITKRSIQNLVSWKDQKKFINILNNFINKKTRVFLIESSKVGLKNINKFRKKANLNEIKEPWHNLYLDDLKIKNTKFNKIKLLKIHEMFSTYYFVSRVLNAHECKKKNKIPNYSDPLNILGWQLPQNLTKGFSQLKMFEFRKK